jgi:hypothetical protein
MVQGDSNAYPETLSSSQKRNSYFGTALYAGNDHGDSGLHVARTGAGQDKRA